MDLETVIQSEVSQRKKSKYRMCVKLLQLCLTLCDPMDCKAPGSSVCGIHPVRILEWVAMPSSRGSSRPRDGTDEVPSYFTSPGVYHKITER